jgi:hypothetical protein
MVTWRVQVVDDDLGMDKVERRRRSQRQYRERTRELRRQGAFATWLTVATAYYASAWLSSGPLQPPVTCRDV